MPAARPVITSACVLMLAAWAAACGPGGGDGTSDEAVAPPPAPTTVATSTTVLRGACGLTPLTFTAERWAGRAAAPSRGPGVLWEQTFTFTNPNPVDVRLSSLVVHLRLAGSGRYFLKMARGGFRPVPDETVPAGGQLQRVAEAWLAEGNSPATEDVFAAASADVAGRDCAVPVERISTGPVPAHVLALETCAPDEAASAC